MKFDFLYLLYLKLLLFRKDVREILSSMHLGIHPNGSMFVRF